MARPTVLEDDLAAVQAAEVDTVVSLLEPKEAALLGLGGQADACTAIGVTFLTHPIRDMHLPEPQAFIAFAARIAADIRTGAHVAVHCRASIGRTGMLTCAVLGHFGYSADAAIAHVGKRRGTQIPDTDEQAAFIAKVISSPTH